jgi:transposase
MVDRERQLLAEIDALCKENEALRASESALRADNSALAATVEELKRRLGELEHRQKSSRSSSMPPSKDSPAAAAEATKSRAERRADQRGANKAEKRRRGKQPGAPGANLEQRDDPDDVVPHEPQRCSDCGEDLAGAPEEGVEVRQVFDIPDPRLVVTEHRSIRRRCSCGKLNCGTFPPEASAPAAYGPNVRAAALYLLHGQHLSVERVVEALSELLGVEVSAGFVTSLVPEASNRLEESGFIEALKSQLRQAEVIHVDETSDQVGTRTWWLHVAATRLYTYLYASHTRGKDAPDRAGVLGEFSGVMVHDRLAMYFNYDGATHAVCAAHLLRDLESVGKWQPQKAWTKEMAELLREMIAATNRAREAGRSRLSYKIVQGFLSRYDDILVSGRAANPPAPSWRKPTSYERDAANLVSAFAALKPEITRFVKDLRVGPTNNEAERSLRMSKLHSKISGCFQSERHAEGFAAVRSYIGTARKHGVDALTALQMMFRRDVWMPPASC